MSAVTSHTVLPPSGSTELLELSGALNGSEVKLLGPDGTQIDLPGEVIEVLRDVVAAMGHGRAITVDAREQVLTTQEAADFLGVSRPTLVRLLTDGKIPFTRPNRHRRVLLEDLIAYQEQSRTARREILDTMSREATAQDYSGTGFETTR